MAAIKFLLVTAFWLLIGCKIMQVNCGSYELKYKPLIFDDQYIGCSEELSNDIMPRILSQEKSNQQFNNAWKNATKWWEKIQSRLDLPDGFEDNHGIALLVFTSKYPEDNPIHQQLNGNLTIAGASRQAYMDNFHFKALHYYLTRALQILKPDCNQTYVTYRGSQDTFKVPPIFKFGRYTSTSLNIIESIQFGFNSFFNITTCFGASIGNFSFFPDEREVLIPAAEQFTYVRKDGIKIFLESTGRLCSFFNCAIQGAEKQEEAVCYTGSDKKKKVTATSTSLAELEERISALEELIIRNHEQWSFHALHIAHNMKDTNTMMQDTVPWMKERINLLEESFKNLLSNIDTINASIKSQFAEFFKLFPKPAGKPAISHKEL